MKPNIQQYLQLHPVDAHPYSDKREPLEQRIYRILTRSRLRSAPLSAETTTFVKEHIHTQVKSNESIAIVYAMGGGRGIGTHNFPHATWAEFLHLKFLAENLMPIGEIYEPGVEVRWSLDDYAARIFNNYKPEWQEVYIKEFDELLAYFTEQSGGKVTHKRFPTDSWYTDFDALKQKLIDMARVRAKTPEAAEIVTDWRKRAANNFYNIDNLEAEALDDAIDFSSIINMVWLDYDFEVRSDFFTSGLMVAHFTAFPDCYYIQTVPGSNTQFWKANGYVEIKDRVIKSRIATRTAWEEIRPKLEFKQNPLAERLPFLGELPVLSTQ